MGGIFLVALTMPFFAQASISGYSPFKVIPPLIQPINNSWLLNLSNSGLAIGDSSSTSLPYSSGSLPALLSLSSNGETLYENFISATDTTDTAPIINLGTEGGTLQSSTPVFNGKALGYFVGLGYADPYYIPSALIKMSVDGTVTPTNIPGEMQLETVQEGVAGAQPRLTIKNNGYIGIGTDTPSSLLTVAGTTTIADGARLCLGNECDFSFDEDISSPTSTFLGLTTPGWTATSTNLFGVIPKQLVGVGLGSNIRNGGFSTSDTEFAILPNVDTSTMFNLSPFLIDEGPGTTTISGGTNLVVANGKGSVIEMQSTTAMNFKNADWNSNFNFINGRLSAQGSIQTGVSGSQPGCLEMYDSSNSTTLDYIYVQSGSIIVQTTNPGFCQ